jgi:hypothetical protein
MTRISRLTGLAFVLVFSLLGVTQAVAQDASPTASSTSVSLSKSNTDSMVAFGQWLFSFPAVVNPGADATGVACGLGQRGTFYLAPSYVGVGKITRSCTVIEGSNVVVPVIAVDCSTAEAAPFHGTDAASLSSCAKTNADAITNAHASIDGTDVVDIASYRQQSPVFNLVLPADNILHGTPGATSLVLDGAFITVKGLTAGTHTITYGGTYQSGGALDITYNLTVAAAPVPAG